MEPKEYLGAPVPIALPASGTVVIHVPTRTIHLRLLDLVTDEPVAGRPYTLTGSHPRRELKGTTGADGGLRHAEVPIDDWLLTLEGEEPLRAPLLDADDPEPCVRWVGRRR